MLGARLAFIAVLALAGSMLRHQPAAPAPRLVRFVYPAPRVLQ